MSNNPALRPPPRLVSPQGNRSQSAMSQTTVRSESSMSNASQDSRANSTPAPLMVNKRSPYLHQLDGRPSTSGGLTPSQSTSTLARGQHAPRGSVDGTVRTTSPALSNYSTGRPGVRQHSQGYFEPSLPNANVPNASQIAAQAAAAKHLMTAPAGAQERKRSHPGITPITSAESSRRPSGQASPQLASPSTLTYSNGTLGGKTLAATTAANVVFPITRHHTSGPTTAKSALATMGPPADKEPKPKSSKMKELFRPKGSASSKDKEFRSPGSTASPGKASSTVNLLRFQNHSVTSLAEPASSASSIYMSGNASTSTLVPSTSERDREKKHHFLSRQKHKLKDDPGALPLSSAHSNSQATNPEHPQPLYNFTSDSPGSSSFAKNFDLRHGGRLLRTTKKEDKASSAAKLESQLSSSAPGASGLDSFLGLSSFDSSMGPPSNAGSVFSTFPSDTVSAQAFSNIGAQMGLPGIGPDDAWPLLKARLLNLFSGENLRPPIEDFNALVSVHVRRCIQRRAPIVLVEDVRELLQTGFGSLAQTLRGIPDERLITSLVEMWIGVYGTILPFLQAVFLPLELEFKGRGNLMSVREAQEFWGAIPEALKTDDRPDSSGTTSVTKAPHLADELEVRRLTLIAFRDAVILPKHEVLLAIFSRLSLDNIHAMTSPALGRTLPTRSDRSGSGAADHRPDTAGSLSPRFSSYTSQGSSNFLEAGSTSSSNGGAATRDGRSRATSATSAGSFGTSLPHLQSPLPALPTAGFLAGVTAHPSPQMSADPAKITETVARMLQCLCVLASCQTADVAQGNVERLTSALKYNWLGRGRTGRDRRGWVGMKAGPGAGGAGAEVGRMGMGIIGAAM